MTKEEGGGECGACKKSATLKCTACSNVYYCSKEHQKKHWKIHKKECWPVAEKKDPQQGRYLVASRDISEGQLVLRERPLALGPPSSSTAVCLGCLNPITKPDFLKCPGCSWPLCNPACAKSPLHVPECAYLATDSLLQGPPQNIDETPRYDVILVLRCLALRSTKPEAWKTIESMVSYAEKYKKEREPYHMTTVKYVSEILTGVCSVDTAHHVRGAIITNAINTKGSRGQTFRAVYPRIYLLNHSCDPNVTLRSDVYGTLHINAATDIKKGDPLVFSYVAPTEPLWRRQEELKFTYNFTCSCKRCNDPTELLTHYSNPRCSKCLEGFLEPGQDYGASWKCPKCEFTKPLEEIIKEDAEFMENFEANSTTVTDAAKLLEDIKKVYHSKHYVWLTAAQIILRNLLDKTAMEALTMKRDIWESILQLFFKLEPGSTRRRGVSLYQFVCTEFEVVKAEEAQGKFSPREYLSALTNISYHLDSAKEIINLEPTDSFEKRWIKLVDQMKEKVSNIVSKLEVRN